VSIVTGNTDPPRQQLPGDAGGLRATRTAARPWLFRDKNGKLIKILGTIGRACRFTPIGWSAAVNG
jgi:hypothetical protein